MDTRIEQVIDDAGLERLLAIYNQVDPRTMSLAAWHAEHRTFLVDVPVLAVDPDGRDVAAGWIGWSNTDLDTGIAQLDVWVPAGERRHGVGRTLFEHLAAIARGGPVTRLHAMVMADDADALAFAEHRGFAVDSSGQLGELTLTPAHADRAPTPIDGIEVIPFSDREDLARAAYDLEAIVQPEIPAMASHPTPAFDAWRADVLDDPGFLRDLSLLALEGDRVVGEILVFDNADGVIFIAMTAVHPDVRRRGVARLLKETLSQRAAAAGVRIIETYNDGPNERIRALNESLGYVYQGRRLLLRGPVPPPR